MIQLVIEQQEEAYCSRNRRGDVREHLPLRNVSADYYVSLLAHAAMEPLVALAEFKDGKATLWAPTQNPQGARDTVSKKLGIAKEDVVCHVTLLGGGFGRKSKPDYVPITKLGLS